MANGTIALDEPSSVDKLLDTEELSNGSDTVQRERIQVTGASILEIARVLNAAPASSDYGLVVRALAAVVGAGAVTALTPRVTLASDDPAVAQLEHKRTRSDTFTGTGNGVTVDASAVGFKHFALQVTETGTVTSWTVVLEGSIDGTTFTTILSHTKAGDGSGVTVWDPRAVPCLYFRARCTALTLGAGTDVVARILGLN